MVYLCPPTAHIARVGAPLNGYVEALVLEYLSSQGIGADLREKRQRLIWAHFAP